MPGSLLAGTRADHEADNANRLAREARVQQIGIRRFQARRDAEKFGGVGLQLPVEGTRGCAMYFAFDRLASQRMQHDLYFLLLFPAHVVYFVR